MSKQRVSVTISDSKLIPTIGKGPINKPISITVPQYEMLKKFGFNINICSEQQLTKIEKAVETTVEAPKVEAEEVVVVEPETPEDVESEEEEAVEEVVEETEEAVEEVEAEEEGDTSYTEEDLKEATKKELKEVLDARGVEYKYNATVPELKELVLSTNPA